MAINEEAIVLNVSETSPYYVGAQAYVTQTQSGAIITIIDKDGTTTATVVNGTNGRGIASATLNDDYTLTLIYTDDTSVTTAPIRGEKGESGVYYGSEEPTDPDINVWIDPDGGADFPEPPTSDGSYVLKVTVTDGVPTYIWESE